MQYRPFGTLDWKASALGFGCMRLPTRGSEAAIDDPEATRMLRWAIDQGVNYLDTGYPYHHGASESLLGRALQEGYRQKVRLATKLPHWLVTSPTDFDRILGEQLAKLQTETIDFYLLHGLDKGGWHKLRDMGVMAWAEGRLAKGDIQRLGFSFHDTYDVFTEIIDAYEGWTLCQIQYNYMDIAEQAGSKGLAYAASKGLAVVVMEPLLGGRLASAPAPVQALWDRAQARRTPAEWGLQWVWNQPEVSVVLSGMSTMAQVQENVASAGRSGVGLLTEDELALVAQVREAYHELCPIPCTRCRYCMPCPNGVDIPGSFETFNTGRMFDQIETARREYAGVAEGQRASACIQCRQCEEKCPQQIPISEWMIHVHEVLGQGKSYEACILA